MLDQTLSGFAHEDFGGPHSGYEDPSMKISERELEKMKRKAENH